MQIQGKHSPKHEMTAQLEQTLPFVHCYSTLLHSEAKLSKSKKYVRQSVEKLPHPKLK